MSKDFGRIDVTQAFRDHEVLITGINGFLGKVLLGLILEGLPEFKHLHILLRSSANLSAQDRFYTHTLRSPALHAFANKSTATRGAGFLAENITVWEGDISRTDCGLEPAALERLT